MAAAGPRRVEAQLPAGGALSALLGDGAVRDDVTSWISSGKEPWTLWRSGRWERTRPPVPPALRSRCRPGLRSPRVSPQRQREEPADTSDLSGEDDDDYVPYVPVKQRKQQMVMG